MSFATSEVLKREDLTIAHELAAEPSYAAPQAKNADVPETQEPIVFSSLKEVERNHIVWTLTNTGGNKALAARLLGISRKSLYDRLAEHGLGETIRNATQAAAMRSLAAQPVWRGAT